MQNLMQVKAMGGINYRLEHSHKNQKTLSNLITMTRMTKLCSKTIAILLKLIFRSMLEEAVFRDD